MFASNLLFWSVHEILILDGWFQMMKPRFWIPMFWVVATLCVVPAFAQQGAQPAPPKQHAELAQKYSELPAGPGKDTLIKVCSKCHSPDNVMANGQDQQGWENTISKMATFGAVGTDDEFTAILDYLVANFPPDAGVKVKINEATAAKLERGLGLSAAEANAIISYRTMNGNFKSMDDLNKVPNVDVKKLDAKQSRIIF